MELRGTGGDNALKENKKEKVREILNIKKGGET